MLSKKVEPILTTDELWVSTDTTPVPTVVSLINTGYPTSNEFAVLSALKKNLSADCPLTVVVLIPVIIPVKPSTLLIDVIFSVLNDGKLIITCGGVMFDYPNPALVTLIADIEPFVIVADAVAVVATPTVPSDCMNVPTPTNGLEILTVALS